MANNRELIRAVYKGYATEKQAKELINSLELSLERSNEINKSLSFNNKTNSVKSVIRETKEEIDWIKKKYGVKE